MGRLSRLIKRSVDFLKYDLWRIRSKELPRHKSFFVRQLRVVTLAVRGFDEDRCYLRASALTFYSLLAIVPVLAMVFAISKGFVNEQAMEQRILESVPAQQQEVIRQVIDFAHRLLENTKGTPIAGIGLLILLWTVMKVLGNIEKSFNDIWGIQRARSLGRKMSDYLSLMLIAPVLMIASSGLTVFINTQLNVIAAKHSLFMLATDFVQPVLKLTPYFLLWCLFTFIYLFIPNLKVRFRSGLLAGIIAGTIYAAIQWVYIKFQIGVANMGAIYGSFAALPLFLIWLQLSWLIVLFGAEISFAHQNADTYEYEPDCLRTSRRLKNLLSLRIVQVCVKHFMEKQGALSAAELVEELGAPIRLVRSLLRELVDAGILSETFGDDQREPSYQPGCDVHTLTIHSVIDMLDRHGSDRIPISESEILNKLKDSLGSFGDAIEQSPANLALKDL